MCLFLWHIHIGIPHCHTALSHITHTLTHSHTVNPHARKIQKPTKQKNHSILYSARLVSVLPSLGYPFYSTEKRNLHLLLHLFCNTTCAPSCSPSLPHPLCPCCELVGNSTAFKVHKSSSSATATEVVCQSLSPSLCLSFFLSLSSSLSVCELS